MSKSNFPYQYIVVEGNIGAGKTTLCQMLSDDLGSRLILEKFADNPFLSSFYENPERFAFQVELFFMAERHKHLQEELSQTDIFQELVIADYFFLKTLLFAQKNLTDEEFRLFQSLFQVLNASFAKPDVIFYLHRPVDVLLKNIAKRGREYEKSIKEDYLVNIQSAYMDYFKIQTALPVVIVNMNDINYDENMDNYNKIKHLLATKFEAGTHYVDFEQL
jgi:deoxyadenosine/deoxycytidine kinase